MKSLTFALIFLSFSIFSQDINTIFSWVEKYAQKPVFKMDTTGLSLIPKTENLCEEDNQFTRANYGCLDFNYDNQNDLIYSGFCKPYDQTKIFLNNADSLKLVVDIPGKVVGYESTHSQNGVFIFKESCCCDYFHQLTYIQMTPAQELNKITISWHRDTQLRFDCRKTANHVGMMRIEPQKNDAINVDPCTGAPTHGNQIMKINGSCFIMSKQKQWKLVLTETSKNDYWIGWIE